MVVLILIALAAIGSTPNELGQATSAPAATLAPWEASGTRNPLATPTVTPTPWRGN